MNLLSYTPSEAEYNRVYNIIYECLKNREDDPMALEKAKEAEEHAKRIVDYVYLISPETYPLSKIK